jgi:hypothetical protein
VQKNPTILRIAFKGTIKLFEVKECWYKNSKAKGSSLYQAVKGTFSKA